MSGRASAAGLAGRSRTGPASGVGDGLDIGAPSMSNPGAAIARAVR